MKVKEFVKIATNAGWRLQRHGGNHDIYTHSEKPGILVVPRHANEEIKRGLLNEYKKLVGF